MSDVTREQLRVCGELTDYSPAEIEAMISAARAQEPSAPDALVYAVALEAMRADHRARAMDQFRRSVGVIR